MLGFVCCVCVCVCACVHACVVCLCVCMAGCSSSFSVITNTLPPVSRHLKASQMAGL